MVANDPVTAFSKHNNIFARPPSLNKVELAKALDLFEHYSKATDRDGEGQDVFWTSSGGHKRAAAHIEGELSRRKLGSVTLELFPKQETLQLRRDFALPSKGGKRRKASSLAALSKVCGSETIYLASNHVDLQERENKYIHVEGFESSKTPFLPIPLVDPNTLGPSVTQSTKRKIFDIYGDGSGNDFASDTPPERITPDLSDDAMTILCHCERSENVYMNILHTTWAATVIDFSPGGGYLALACIRARIPIVVFAKSSEHKDVLNDFFVSVIKRAMENTSDHRFYKTATELGIAVEERLPGHKVEELLKAKGKPKRKAKAEPKATNARNEDKGADESEDDDDEESE